MSSSALERARAFIERAARLDALYRRGEIHVRVPPGLEAANLPLEDVVARCLPASKAALDAASRALFYSLPVAFDPSESVGPYLATADRDERGEPYRFLDMGAQIATHAYGENAPEIIESVLEHLPFAVARYAHSEYQTTLSLKLKAELAKIAPKGTPRYFMVNTGAEAVENAIKAVLLHRVKTSGGNGEGGFIISFDSAFHGRTLGSLAVTHRKKARLGFPTFDWPHVPLPVDDPRSKPDTLRREEQSLRQIWDLLVTGRLPNAPRSKEQFKRELDAIDELLASRDADLARFVREQRAKIPKDVLARARRAAGVLVEPIQGEGGVRMASARFMQRLRVLTLVYDVPLMFDEVQAGWGTAGTMWAHELFELPAPPDVVVWAKKAQNGVLFVSEELATFFQEEKKFNTTWEGDSAGMARLLAILPKLDLEQVRRTGALAREGLDALERDYSAFVQNVRGAGVMLAFDVVRSDWRDVLRDRAFRHGLILLPAGERALRFYPRYDTEPYAMAEAFEILRRALDEIVGGRATPDNPLGPELRVGSLDVELDALEVLDVSPESFPKLKSDIMKVEVERYGVISQYPPDVLEAGGRPLLQYPVETLEATVELHRSIGVALRDRVSGRIVAYALGSPVENHDEEGVREDPRNGEGNTFYLQAMATLPSCRNQDEVENLLLDLVRARAAERGFENFSALIEARLRISGPEWVRSAVLLKRIDNYLRSGIQFVYLQAPLRERP
ncbi:aminotransferase class III-fold pyridoxal phosphate-dependent enzyme [Myxococcota bacterium]|nr:aminotransferase class III-fold pyridoxal phosphate-dependent enzyme [Myxococcota bacterium]